MGFLVKDVAEDGGLEGCSFCGDENVGRVGGKLFCVFYYYEVTGRTVWRLDWLGEVDSECEVGVSSREFCDAVCGGGCVGG